MKICLLFNHYRTPQERGGARSYQIGTFLAQKGHRVTAVIPGVDSLTGNKSPLLRGRFYIKDQLENVTLYRVNSTSNQRSSRVSRFFYYLSSSCTQFFVAFREKNIEIIIANSLPLTQLFFAYILSTIRKVPFIVDVRDLPLDTAVEIGYFRSKRVLSFFMAVENFVLKRATAIATVSRGFQKKLIQRGVQESKIFFFPIGYDCKLYDHYLYEKPGIRKKFQIENAFVVLYAGTMGFLIDIMTILKAAKETRHHTKIVYVFAGSGQKLDEYRSFVEKNHIQARFIGSISKADVIQLSWEADICVYALQTGPMLASLLGNKVFDHLGTATPMLYCGPKGDLSDILSCSGGGECFPSQDYLSLAQRIVSLSTQPDRVHEMGERGRRYILKHYRSESYMQKLEQVILRIHDN